jgi:hypothetical protein
MPSTMNGRAPNIFVKLRMEDRDNFYSLNFPNYQIMSIENDAFLLSDSPCQPHEWQFDEPFTTVRAMLRKLGYQTNEMPNLSGILHGQSLVYYRPRTSNFQCVEMQGDINAIAQFEQHIFSMGNIGALPRVLYEGIREKDQFDLWIPFQHFSTLEIWLQQGERGVDIVGERLTVKDPLTNQSTIDLARGTIARSYLAYLNSHQVYYREMEEYLLGLGIHMQQDFEEGKHRMYKWIRDSV